MTRRRAAVIAAAGLVGLASFLSIHGNMPSPSSPFAMASTLPALWLDGVRPQFVRFTVSCVPVVTAFLLFSAHLFQGKDEIPPRSVLLLAVLSLLSVGWFCTSWSYGIDYQGKAHTVYAAASNGILAIAAAGLLMLNRRTPRFGSNLAFHGTVFAWLAWCAFPWLGELI